MSITVLADQCVGIPIIQALREAGVDILRSSDLPPANAPDSDILAAAVRQGRILLTEDSDFGEMVVRMAFPALGIIRLDLEGMARSERVQRAVTAIQQIGDQARGALVTVGPKRIRIRPL
jgi:predicted nuclease of predicted toxin-antitoxin system